MATQWVLEKISGALQPTIQSGVSTAGGYAGGAFNAVGNGISGVGESINGTIRRYGDGVKDYGNGMLDWTNASASRGQTASNPLGLSGGSTGGKRAVTSPIVYRAPATSKSSASKTLTTTSKQSPAKKTAPPIKKAVTSVKTTNTKAPTARKTTPVVKSGVPKKVVKPSTVTATKPKTLSSQGTNSAALNPLGLK